jgi:hypothetical protein
MAEFDFATRLQDLLGHPHDPRPTSAQPTDGGGRHLDYAAPYVDVSAPDTIHAFLQRIIGGKQTI